MINCMARSINLFLVMIMTVVELGVRHLSSSCERSHILEIFPQLDIKLEINQFDQQRS